MAAILLEMSKEATLDHLTDRYKGNWHGRDIKNILEGELNCPLSIRDADRDVSFSSSMKNATVS